MKINSLFYENSMDNVICKLCPRECFIKPGNSGYCKVRKNIDGDLYSMNYGNITAFSVDPIEKKPLYHYKPGYDIASFGSWGCNLGCPYCQNSEITKKIPEVKKNLRPDSLNTILKKYDIECIAFTYSEPVVWYEFILDSLREIKNGDNIYYTVLVTNGYINPEPWNLILQYTDAVNIDLKSFNAEKFRDIFDGDIEVIKRNIEKAYERGVHTEITTPVVPEINDNISELEEEFKWIGSISETIPLHLSKYYPRYEYTKPSTDEGFLIEMYNTAKKYLKHVYLGNFWDSKYQSTYCSYCGNEIIERNGYNVKLKNINKSGGCNSCGKTEIII
ncbi:MAG: AmmeMemoRadiSam system radical SAM enzyme [Thermotogae bacterium]|nr:AmmeMemoRadiSam system radical SAM enzyme [Thermotogota bacterium]